LFQFRVENKNYDVLGNIFLAFISVENKNYDVLGNIFLAFISTKVPILLRQPYCI